MRTLLGVAFVVVTGVAAFTYRDLILGRHVKVQQVLVPAERFVPLARPAPVIAKPAPVVEPSPTIAELNAVDSLVTMHIMALQADPLDVRSMTDLAFLYMKQGWFDEAVEPLARAREIDATSESLRRYLELAVARSVHGPVDLFQAARNFEDRVANEGHGC